MAGHDQSSWNSVGLGSLHLGHSLVYGCRDMFKERNIGPMNNFKLGFSLCFIYHQLRDFVVSH